MDVFVYGTLTDPERVDALLDDWSFGPDAVLRGAHRVDGRYPTLVPGGETCGRILHTSAVATLDRYEGVDAGLYRRVTVTREGGDADGSSVQLYVGDPGELRVSGAAADWPDGRPTLDVLAELISDDCVVAPTSE